VSPYTPSPLERKVGRRSILIGGAIAAAAVIGGGVAALEAVHSHTPAHPQTGAQSTPVPGPRKLIPGVPLLRLTGHTGAVWMAAWHPAGHYLLTAARDGIMLWDVASALQNNIPGSEFSTPMRKWTVAGIKFENLTEGVSWSKDGQKVIAGGSLSDKLYVLDVSDSSSAPTIYRDLDLAILGDAAIYVNTAPGPRNDLFTAVNSAITGSQAQVWRLGQTEEPVINYDVADDLDVLQWSPDGSMLAAITGGLAKQNGFYLWKSSDPLHPRFFISPRRNAAIAFGVIADTIAWSPTTPYLLLISNADEALIWDVRKDQPTLILNAEVDPSIPAISKLSWSPNGRYVIGSYDPLGDNTTLAVNPQFFVWDIQDLLKGGASSTPHPPSLTFSAPTGSASHTKAIIDLNWSPDGRYLATSSFDQSVIIWKVDA
jgi:WD40 repeat protein